MVDAAKIAKLRAKAMSTAYPEEAKSFKRKANDLMEQHGISEEAVHERQLPQAVQIALVAKRSGRRNVIKWGRCGA